MCLTDGDETGVDRTGQDEQSAGFSVQGIPGRVTPLERNSRNKAPGMKLKNAKGRRVCLSRRMRSQAYFSSLVVHRVSGVETSNEGNRS